MTKRNTRAFGRVLRAAREAASLSQANLAEHLGVTDAYVSHVEQGKRPPFTGEVMTAAARFLGAPLAEFVSARAQWNGFIEVPVTGDAEADGRAVVLAAMALEAKWTS